MKKISVFWLVLAIIVLSAFSAMAGGGSGETTAIRRSILITGEFQRYMNFNFTVTSVNCGNLEVSEFKKGNPFFGVASSWDKKYIGERVTQGWYRFNVTGADLTTCAPVIDIIAEVPTWTMTGNYIGSFMEVEPEDLGLLVKGGTTPTNVFNLSTDDRAYSYEMIVMAPGTERELTSFANDTHFFSDTGKGIVGAIFADSRGFLKNKIMFGENLQQIAPASKTKMKGLWHNWKVQEIAKNLEVSKPLPSEIIVREGDVVVLIRKEM